MYDRLVIKIDSVAERPDNGPQRPPPLLHGASAEVVEVKRMKQLVWVLECQSRVHRIQNTASTSATPREKTPTVLNAEPIASRIMINLSCEPTSKDR